MSWFFGLHNYAKPGRGVSKNEPRKRGFFAYFDILCGHFWHIIALNLFYIAFSVPGIIISFFLSTYMTSWIASVAEISHELESALTLIGLFMTVVLVQVCGTGPASAAMAYVLRKYVNNAHAWMFSDFVDNVRSNLRQGMCVYLINIALAFVGLICFTFYNHVMTGALASVLRYIFTALAALFIMMQMYTYQLMAGFEMSLKNIYKYSAMLVFAKLPWNILCIAVTAGLMYLVYILVMSYPAMAFILVLTFFYSVITFTQIFMSNNVVKKYILEPALRNVKTEEDDIETIFEEI